MNRRFHNALVAMALATVAGGAVAEPCEGVNARRYAEPVVVHEGKDGSRTVLLSSTGSSTTTRPVTSVRWQNCTGLWTAEADGAGAGAGHCYSVDGEGDRWVISWEGTRAGGTWAHVSGTGKFANLGNAKGKWAYGERFPDGMTLTTWSGDCGT